MTGAYTKDRYCNIYDFIGNVSEWTTEYSNYINSYNVNAPCVARGGFYLENNTGTASSRGSNGSNTSIEHRAFRIQLLIKEG